MAVPEEIRKVERPVGTIVEDSKKAGDNRYIVRERKGFTYVKGSNPKPHNGKVIGHIINGVYVPKIENVKKKKQFLQYGASKLACSVCDDIYSDLIKIFSINNSQTIIAMAVLKCIKPNITCDRMNSYYERNFLSIWYPNASLSKNSISTFLNNLGSDYEKRKQFYVERVNRISSNQKIVIDGVLKQDNSTVNDLSNYSYKAKNKQIKEISILYAYDIESEEPICSQVFPGNCVDASAYSTFIQQNEIKKGIIIDDKGFPVKKIEKELKESPDLHFLTPLKRNDKKIDEYDLLSYNEIISGYDTLIIGKKTKTNEGRYLYSFKDTAKSCKEELDFLKRDEKKKKFRIEKYYDKKDTFGTIVLESDLDMTIQEAYKCYDKRWELELIFRSYKNDIDLDKTNVQSDYSVIGNEFVNFISVIITKRMIKEMREVGLLNNLRYGEILEDLCESWRMVIENDTPKQNDKYWFNTIVKVQELLLKLNLCTK